MQKKTVCVTTDLLVIDGESLTHFAKGSAGTVKDLKGNKKLLCVQQAKITLPNSVIEKIVAYGNEKGGEIDEQ